MRNRPKYEKILKVLGAILAISLFVLLFSTLMVMLGGGSGDAASAAVTTTSIFAVSISCGVSALTLIGILATVTLRRQADRQAPPSASSSKPNQS